MQYTVEASSLTDRGLLLLLLERIQLMAANLNDLQTAVRHNTEVEQSALVLIQGLVAKLEAAQGDPAAVQSLIDELKVTDDQLAAAVAANTTPTPQPE